MPLFGRKLFDHISKDINPDDECYTIEHTGEKFSEKNVYEKLLKVYVLERWTCECTWKAGLTHKQAYQSEIDIRKSLATIVPDYFNKPIFEIIYHNVKPLEKLAEEVSIILGQSFVIGEPVQFKKKKDNNTIKGIVERIEDNNDDLKKRTSERASVQLKSPSDKQMKNVKYSIRLSDENEIIDNVLPSELQRCSFIPNREKLKTFIRSYAIRLGNRVDSPWIFYDKSIIDKYELKERIPADIVEKFIKSSTITLDEIIREQERIARKQAEEQAATTADNNKTNEINNNISIPNGHSDEIIILPDDKPKSETTNENKPKKASSSPSTPKKSSPTKKSKSPPSKQKRSPTKAKKQLTLHDMKFTKNSLNHNDLLEKSSSTTYDISVPYSLLQKLDKTRRDRGIDSKFFNRLILQCARTLNDKQRLRLPDEYRQLIQIKYDELELKRRLSTMTDEEKKLFLLNKRLEQKPIEDLDLKLSKNLPLAKELQTKLSLTTNSINDLLFICTFLTSCHTLFSLSLNDDIPKTTQFYLKSFKFDCLLNTSPIIFTNFFIEILQLFIKLLFKEDENRSNNSENNDDEEDNDKEQDKIDDNDSNNNKEKQIPKINYENMDLDKDIEQIYSIQLTDIPLTTYTCQELTRLYLSKEKDDNNQIILDKLATHETKDLTSAEQVCSELFNKGLSRNQCHPVARFELLVLRKLHRMIIEDEGGLHTNMIVVAERKKISIDLLLLLVNTITTDNELMSDYFEYLARILSEASRERNQLLAERRKAQEEESKEKKLQLQNGENQKSSSKKQTKLGPLITPKNSSGTTNDENRQTSPMIVDENGDIENGNDDDLKTVLQRRRQMVAMSKELKEKREIEAQKLQIKQKRQLAIQKAEQAYQEALLNYQYGFRMKPLGFDRNYNRYWFFRGYPGIFVEKGWVGSNISYCAEASPSSQDSPSSSSAHNEKFIPKDEINQWFVYDDENTIQEFLQSLNDRGIREHNLSVNLKKTMPLIHNEFEQMKKSKNSLEQQEENVDLSNDMITSFKTELEDIETRLRLGSLGGFIQHENLLEWQNKLKQANQRSDLGELLIQLQQTVADKNSSGIFNLSDKKSLQIWINDCRTCKTYSRLYVLMLIFENCINWNKSILGLKCKICRRKHKDESLIVCDQCYYGYHHDCLRDRKDVIKNISNDLWYCPACRPVSKRREKKKINYNIDDHDDMEVDQESNSTDDNDDNLSDSNQSDNNGDMTCSVCSEEGDEKNLIECTQCHLYYHCHCHEPPLRCPPRSTTWICNHCRNGIHNNNHQTKTTKKNNRNQRSVRKNYCEKESDDDEESRVQRRSKRLRRSDPSPVKTTPKTRRSRLAKSISSSSSSNEETGSDQNNDDDDDENDDENENNSDDSPSSD